MTKLYAPTADTYTFTVYHDDGNKFILNGATMFDSLTSSCL